jgi:hypothetical protein
MATLKHSSVDAKSIKQIMVIDKDGKLYAASNATSAADAMERHYSDIGVPWREAFHRGDRLVNVKITITKTKSKL